MYEDPQTQVQGGQGYGAPLPPPQHYGGYPGGYGRGMGMGRGMGSGMQQRRHYPIETKPFLLTSEFAVLIVALIALLITTLTNPEDLFTRTFWILTTILCSAYMISRGIAKSGTRSMSWDPREQFEPGRSGGQSGHGGHGGHEGP